MTGDILFLAHRRPFPPDRGDSIRSWNILNALADIAPVHLVSFGEADDAASIALAEVCASVQLIPHRRTKIGAMAASLLSGRPASVELFRSAAFAEAVSAVMAAYPVRVIYAFSGQMAQYAPTGGQGPRFVMDFTDVDSQKFASYAKAGGVSGLANRIEAARLLRFERAVAARADVSLFVSAAEEALFRRVSGLTEPATAVLENGVDLTRFCAGTWPRPQAAGDAPLIIFTGQMDYLPNIDAVTWFAHEVLPLVRDRQADARFAIVGRAPTEAVRALGALPGVIVTGEVPDTRPWLSAAQVVVAPLRIARGIQNKVLEAMASAKAVVASPEAAEGIDACHGKELLIAQTAAAQADAVLSLLHDPARRVAMEAAARAAMEARYSWAAKLAPLANYIGMNARQVPA